MTSIDEILNGMDVEDYFHDKIQFSIDENLRLITVPSDGVILGVVGDKDVNRINFQMPKSYNGFDMSEFSITVNYRNANGNVNFYTVTDSTSANDFIVFTWLIGSDVTVYDGEVEFNIQMVKMVGSEVSQRFNTTIATGKILKSIDIDSYISNERNRLAEQTEFGNLVCFTDSIGQGQNNNDYSYIDVLNETGRFNSVTKAAVGSATFGKYTGASNHEILKWAVGSSFYEQARKTQYQEAIKNADNIIVQYMANDVLAILAGYVQIGTPSDTGTTTICGMVKSTLDYIYSINKDVVITWIGLFNSEKNVQYYANAYKVMSDRYSLGHTYSEIEETSKALHDAMFTIFVNYNCNIMPILEGKAYNSKNSDSFFSSDKVHPNTMGHKLIARQYLKTARGGQEISWNELLYRLDNVKSVTTTPEESDSEPTVVSEGKYKTFTMTVDTSTFDKGTTDVSIDTILEWYNNGYEVKGICNMNGIDIVFNIATVYASRRYITMGTHIMAQNSISANLMFAMEIYQDYKFTGLKAFDMTSVITPMSTVVASMSSS